MARSKRADTYREPTAAEARGYLAIAREHARQLREAHKHLVNTHGLHAAHIGALTLSELRELHSRQFPACTDHN